MSTSRPPSPIPPPASPAPSALARGVWRWSFAVALAVIVVLASGQSQIAAPSMIPDVDKLGHFGVFGLLASLVVRAPGRRRAWPVCAVVLVSLFGISDEFHQSFTPGRSVEFDDWIADTLGAMLAVTLYVRWTAYRRLMEWRLPLPRLGGRRSRPGLAPESRSDSVSVPTHS